MRNEAKSIEIAGKVADGYGIDLEPLAEATLDMAEWKDQQLKEYLEKKKEKLILLQDDVSNQREFDLIDYRISLINEIINELFKGGLI